MKIEKSKLSNALSLVARVVRPSAPLHVLRYVLVGLAEGDFDLRATDLETTILVRSNGEVFHRACVNHALLTGVLSTLDDEIEVEYFDDAIKITCGEAEFDLKTLPASEYPELPGWQDDPREEVRGGGLLAAMERVAHAAHKDAGRGLDAVYIDGENVVATDGFRLAVAPLSLEIEPVVIPIDAARTAVTALQGSEVSLSVTPGRSARLDGGDVVVWTQLYDTKYLDYHAVLKKSMPDNVIVAGRSDLMTAVKRASLFGECVRLVYDGGELVIESNGSDGASRDVVEVLQHASRWGGQMTLNARYLLDALNAAREEVVQLGYNGADKPFVLSQDGYTEVIMPIVAGGTE